MHDYVYTYVCTYFCILQLLSANSHQYLTSSYHLPLVVYYSQRNIKQIPLLAASSNLKHQDQSQINVCLVPSRNQSHVTDVCITSQLYFYTVVLHKAVAIYSSNSRMHTYIQYRHTHTIKQTEQTQTHMHALMHTQNTHTHTSTKQTQLTHSHTYKHPHIHIHMHIQNYEHYHKQTMHSYVCMSVMAGYLL